MSRPEFPIDPKDLTRENAVNQILSSIAMEELGLSHIMNAEGEKLQYVLGTLKGSTGPTGVTVDDVLKVNESVQSMMRTAGYNQMFLKKKMTDALSTPTMQGPAGPAGATGATGILEDPLWRLETDGGGFDVNYKDTVTVTSDSLAVTREPDTSALRIELPASVPFFNARLTTISSETLDLSLADYIVPFDTVSPDSALDLGYTAADNGVFTLQPGVYLVNWWIILYAYTLNTSTPQFCVKIALTFGDKTQYIVASVTDYLTAANTTVINITAPDTPVSLIFPQQHFTALFTDYPEQAGISFTKIF